MRAARVRGGERGSTLMLVPAGFLVVVIMASIAIDMAIVQLRQRQASDFASSAANDAATAAADELRQTGGHGVVRIDPGAALDLVRRELAASELAPLVVRGPSVRVSGNHIDVSVSVRANYVFAKALPGAPGGTTVTVHAGATADTLTDGGDGG